MLKENEKLGQHGLDMVHWLNLSGWGHHKAANINEKIMNYSLFKYSSTYDSLLLLVAYGLKQLFFFCAGIRVL